MENFGLLQLNNQLILFMEHIVYGDQCVNVISALCGGNAERILRRISEGFDGSRQRWQFDQWKGNVCKGVVTLPNGGRRLELTLKLDTQEGLFLKDDSHASSFSLKYEGGGVIALPIGRLDFKCLGRRNVLELTSPAFERRIQHAAEAIVGTWVAHGYDSVPPSSSPLDQMGFRVYWPFALNTRGLCFPRLTQRW